VAIGQRLFDNLWRRGTEMLFGSPSKKNQNRSYHVKKITFAIVSGLILLSCGTNAAETGPVREFYACTFNEGKGMADLESFRDFLVEQIDKIGSPDVSAGVSFVWTPYKTNPGPDFLWFDMSANLNALGRAADAFNSSPEGAPAVQARIDEVASCGAAGIVYHDQIYDGGEDIGPPESGAALLEFFSCQLNPGKTLADARAAVDVWRGVLDGLGIYKSYDAYMWTPLIATTEYDLSYFAVHNNMTDYAARQTAYVTSDAGRNADAGFGEVHRCDSALWWGHPFITAEE
jgi:hypothetical protein